MKVTLLASTPNATKVVATAAWVCTHPELPTETDLHPDKCGPLVRRVIGYGHHSILEHASFTFAIEGIGRACSHQLVRYRIASFSQQSQRYVEANNFDVVVPASIQVSKHLKKFGSLMADIKELYTEMIKDGVPKEDARFILPNATTTKLTMTMNARELWHFFAQRLCKQAQWEIRQLAEAIHTICIDKASILFEGSGPDCKNCKEKNPCKPASSEE